MTVLVFAVPALLSAAAWLYLVAAHGRFWLADQRLPARPDPSAPLDQPEPAGGWPDVVAIVPARDEAAVLPLSLPTLLGQDYPGRLRIILVDDASGDGTAQVAEKLAAEQPNRTLDVIRGDGPAPGWAGKVAAMNRGFEAAARLEPAPSEYVLFTDADIAHSADNLRRLVAFGEARGLDLVSLMVRLRTETAAERAIVPAFVYSFAQLYPFPLVNRPRSRVAAAAGGCMLVRRSALVEAGGLAGIAGARIDDVALGTLLKRRPNSRASRPVIGPVTGPVNGAVNGRAGGRIWLGLTTSVHSIRPYPRLADLWDMIARSAYTQLRHSMLLLGGTLLGLLLLYAVPPVFGLAFLAAALSGGGGGSSGWQIATATAALAAWALMSVSYLPTLRLYRLGSWRAPLLPLVMMLYGAMTFDSALRHYRGSGGRWKGRIAQ